MQDFAGTLLFISKATPDLTADLRSAQHIAFKDLTAQTLQRLDPKIVVCALFNQDYDAIMVLERLKELGFQGQCLVMSAKLPQLDLVLAELIHTAGDISVSLHDTAAF